MDVGVGTDAAIRTVRLRKDYGSRTAVSDLDLTVHPGEVFGVLGPNGAGKSTTIRVMLDLLRPTSGTVEVLGVDPRRGGGELRRRIGYLPSDFTVYQRDSAEAVLHALGTLRGGVADSRIADLAERLNLDLNRRVRELSKGNLQKVGLVQAFMHDPELLVLDEPTAGLDPLLRQEFIRMVAEARSVGRRISAAQVQWRRLTGARRPAFDRRRLCSELSRRVRRVRQCLDDGVAPKAGSCADYG